MAKSDEETQKTVVFCLRFKDSSLFRGLKDDTNNPHKAKKYKTKVLAYGFKVKHIYKLAEICRFKRIAFDREKAFNNIEIVEVSIQYSSIVVDTRED